jgi:hypothetical protein
MVDNAALETDPIEKVLKVLEGILQALQQSKGSQ